MSVFLYALRGDTRPGYISNRGGVKEVGFATVAMVVVAGTEMDKFEGEALHGATLTKLIRCR